jgi:hypothetical protein
MPRLRVDDGREIHAGVESCESPAVLNGQAEQVQICELTGPEDSVTAEDSLIKY